jgi:hypothetical protein
LLAAVALLSLLLTGTAVSDRAHALHFSSLVFDGHIHAINRTASSTFLAPATAA